jgi:hypothetical protein
MGISNNFNDKTGTAGYDWLKYFLAKEPKVEFTPW